MLSWPVPAAAIASDVFFATFLILGGRLVFSLSADDLERRAASEDEGAGVVTLMTLAALAYVSFGIFLALNEKSHRETVGLILTIAGAPLGWLMLQMLMTFHYANIYYRQNKRDDYVPPIKFDACPTPGPWEFLYVAMTVGMTAQVSDTNVQTTQMRRAILAHAAVSYFFNTVLIAMAVNAAVTIAS